MRAIVVVISLAVVAGACVDPPPPPDGPLLCLSDDECPAGLSCNLDRHLCVGADDDVTPPSITRVAFEPSIVSAGVARLVIEADEDLDPAVHDVALVQGELTFAAEPQPTPREHVLLVDTAGLSEGAHTVGTVTIADVAGNRTTAPVGDVSLIIDRTAPRILDPELVDVPADRTYTDGVGPDTIVARFAASEALEASGARLIVGARQSAPEDCVVAEGELVITCSSLVDAAASDGPVDVRVALVDRAGNVGESLVDSVVIDTAAPVLLDAQMRIRTGILETDAASQASVVTLDLLADEVVSAAVVTLVDTDGVEHGFTVEGVDTRRLTATMTTLDLPEGLHEVRVQLTDRFQHTSAELTLDQRVPFELESQLLCTAPGVVTCIDLDNDGRFASVSCEGGSDPNDLDPLTYSGAVDIPGDGIDNDGVAGDVPIDEVNGVFVDSENGDDAGACTRTDPCLTLAEARVRAQASALPFLFLAARATAYPVPVDRILDSEGDPDREGDRLGAVGLVGGLTINSTTGAWERTEGRSRVSGPGATSKGVLLDHVEMDSFVALRVMTVTGSAFTSLSLQGRGESVIVNSVIGGVLDVNRAGDDGQAPTFLRMQRSTVGILEVQGVALVDRSSVGPVTLQATNARVLMTNSVVVSPAAPAIQVAGTVREASVEVLHSTLITNAAPVVVADDSVTGNTSSPFDLHERNLVLVNNILVRSVPGVVLRTDVASRVFVSGNVVSPGTGDVIFAATSTTTSDTFTLSEVAASCLPGATRCAFAANTALDDPDIDGGGVLQLGSDIDDSPSALGLPNIPTTLLADRDFECRDLAFPEPGADEIGN